MFSDNTAELKRDGTSSRRIDLNQKWANLSTNNIPPGPIAIATNNAASTCIGCPPRAAFA
jgi:hypothetical protein